jgi:hypothetical protein
MALISFTFSRRKFLASTGLGSGAFMTGAGGVWAFAGKRKESMGADIYTRLGVRTCINA